MKCSYYHFGLSISFSSAYWCCFSWRLSNAEVIIRVSRSRKTASGKTTKLSVFLPSYLVLCLGLSLQLSKSKASNCQLVDKTKELNFKTIVHYTEKPTLPLAPMFLLLPVICDISDPPSQYLVNPWDPRAKDELNANRFQRVFAKAWRLLEARGLTFVMAYTCIVKQVVLQESIGQDCRDHLTTMISNMFPENTRPWNEVISVK